MKICHKSRSGINCWQVSMQSLTMTHVWIGNVFSLAEISVYCHLGKKLKKRNQRWYLWIRLVKCNYLILHWPFYLIAFILGSHIFSNLGCSQLSGKFFPSLRFCRQHKPADVDPFHKLCTYVRGNQSWISSERTICSFHAV